MLLFPFSLQIASQIATGWTWNFGDGATSTAQSPTHTYSAEGTYNVNLVVGNAAGNSSKTATITVQKIIPEPDDNGHHSSGGSGGGRAGGSPEPQSNVKLRNFHRHLLLAENL